MSPRPYTTKPQTKQLQISKTNVETLNPAGEMHQNWQDVCHPTSCRSRYKLQPKGIKQELSKRRKSRPLGETPEMLRYTICHKGIRASFLKTVVYYALLYYIVLCKIMLHYTTRYYTITCCMVLYYITLHYFALC